MYIKYLKELPEINAPNGYRYVLVKTEGQPYGAERFTYRAITVQNGITFVPGHDITGWVSHLPTHNPDHHLQFIDDMELLGKYI
jgi:hypothetical protein